MIYGNIHSYIINNEFNNPINDLYINESIGSDIRNIVVKFIRIVINKLNEFLKFIRNKLIKVIPKIIKAIAILSKKIKKFFKEESTLLESNDLVSIVYISNYKPLESIFNNHLYELLTYCDIGLELTINKDELEKFNKNTIDPDIGIIKIITELRNNINNYSILNLNNISKEEFTYEEAIRIIEETLSKMNSDILFLSKAITDTDKTIENLKKMIIIIDKYLSKGLEGYINLNIDTVKQSIGNRINCLKELLDLFYKLLSAESNMILTISKQRLLI